MGNLGGYPCAMRCASGCAMNVVVGSAHRNNEQSLPHYFRQVERLRSLLAKRGDFVRVIAAEGDSSDATQTTLLRLARERDIDLDLLDCSHNGPEFGSVETVERMEALSKVGNAIFDAVLPTDDVLVYIESDLHWDATVLKLIDHAVAKTMGFSVFSPLVMAETAFYDIWGFRGLDGRRFSPFSPFYPGLLESEIFEVGSVGSCLVMPGFVARECRIIDDYCLVGWCRDARGKGHRIGVVPSVFVRQA